mmetsp:Transcript_9648/g.32702  ORF Transcript_9648/g.32702 Transcript_9648/m.32702 type:complete len:231 (-) Transcript_9648:2-694(-)
MSNALGRQLHESEASLRSNLVNDDQSPLAGWRRKKQHIPDHLVTDAMRLAAIPSSLKGHLGLKRALRKRAMNRWSALLTRIGSSMGMRSHLGDQQFDNFCKYARHHYQDQFVDAFDPDSRVLRCAGPIDGGECPRAWRMSVDDPLILSKLEELHVDHEYDLARVCAVWKQALGPKPACWHRGEHHVRPRAVCDLLFKMSNGSAKGALRPSAACERFGLQEEVEAQVPLRI